MSAARDRGLIEVKQAGKLSDTSPWTPVLVRHSLEEHAGWQTPSPRHAWKNWLGAAAVVAATVGIVTYQPWHKLTAASAAAETRPAEAAATVTIARPAPAVSASVVLPATFRPWQTATLHARVSGYLTAWHRDLGATVKAGELLAEIETPELDQELAEGEALAREADAAVVQAQAERVEAQAELRVAEAQLLRTQAEHELAKSQLSRRDKLVKTRVISQEEHDTFQRQVEARAADVAAAQADVARRSSSLETRAAIIAARQATASSRQANVERLNELQRFKRIVAPFDGVVTRRAAEVGLLVTADKEPLYVVEDLSRIRVQMNVPQTYAMQTRPGVTAEVSLPESHEPPVQGEITRIAASVDSGNRTMLAEIELDNATNRFQPGSYAQVTLVTSHNGTAWTIPINTLSMRIDGPHVALVDSQNLIELKRVTLGRDLGDRVVVAEGIRGGERLVVNPRDSLTDGLRVQVNQRAESAAKLAQR